MFYLTLYVHERYTMTAQSKRNRRGKLSPLIIIGGSILVLAVAFLFISDMILDNRDPEVSRTIAEKRGEDSPVSATAFRNDAQLSFTDSDGNPLADVQVEIAETEQARTQGLMGRDRMREDQGMLFIFPTQEYRSFWMANTPISLDIIFVNTDREIVTIQRNTVPYSEEGIPSTAPAMYVIEVNAGYCDRHGIREGHKAGWIRQ